MSAWDLSRRAWAVLALAGVAVAAIGAGVATRPAPAPVPPAPTSTVSFDLRSAVTSALAGAVAAAPSAAARLTLAPPPAPAAALTTAAAPRATPRAPRAHPVAAPAAPAAPAAAPAALAARVVAGARLYLGVPYVWGGITRAGLDCSGLVYVVLRGLGLAPPRTADAQMRWSVRITHAQAGPGDLVFGMNPDGTAHHVGVYLGGDQMIDAPNSGGFVGVHPLYADSTVFGRIP